LRHAACEEHDREREPDQGLSVTVEIAASATITGMIAAASDTSGRVVWCRAAAEAPGRS
jgi:hypothetical protein